MIGNFFINIIIIIIKFKANSEALILRTRRNSVKIFRVLTLSSERAEISSLLVNTMLGMCAEKRC